MNMMLMADVAGWGEHIGAGALGFYNLVRAMTEGFIHYAALAFQTGGLVERLLLLGIFTIVIFALSVFLGVFLRNSLRSMPFLKRQPWGMPSSDAYLARPTGFDRPMPFAWSFPVLEIAGDRYDMRYAWKVSHKKQLQFELPTGTIIQFVQRERA
jgi:hypothetical protein